MAESIEKVSESLEEDPGSGESGVLAEPYTAFEEDPEGELLVWALAHTLYKSMGGKEEVVVSIVEDGLPVSAYPPERYMYIDSEEAEEQEPPAAVRDSEAGVALVTLSPRQFKLLSTSAKAGEGEVVVIRDDEALEALYSMARALAQTLTGSRPLASYVAYKAILKASRRGFIKFNPEALIDKLPLEDAATRRRVREQVLEELKLQRGENNI